MLEVDRRVAVLIFQRDDVRNALTETALVDDLLQTADWANAENGISVLIITGDGAAFSSGGKIERLSQPVLWIDEEGG